VLKLTNTQLVNRLRRLDACTFISLRAVVVPTMRKEGNPWHGRVLKVVTAAGVLNARYSRVVNRQRLREGLPEDFRAKSRQWGERQPDCPLVKFIDRQGRPKYYLDIKIQSRTDQFRDITSGAVVTKDLLEDFLRSPQKTRQGVNKRIAMRDFRIDRIAEIRIQGEVWQIRSGFARLQRLLKGRM